MILLRNTQRVLEEKQFVGKNMFDKNTLSGVGIKFSGNGLGGTTTDATFSITDYIRIKPSTAYIRYGFGSNVGCFYDKNKVFISEIYTAGFTAPSTAHYFRSSVVLSAISTAQLELNRTATAYEPYSQTALNTNSLVDRSRFANNGTFSNVTWVKLASGLQVMNFNGVDSYVEIPDSPSMRMVNGGTIKAWVFARSSGESSAGQIISKGTGYAGQNGYHVYWQTPGNIHTQINAGVETRTQTMTSPYSTWKHIAVVFSVSGRKIYVNGVDSTFAGGAETALPPDVAGVVRIGNYAGATDRTFDGYIGGVEMLSKVWTQADVLRSFTAERGLYGV